MTQQEWIEEFARILADKLEEPIGAVHLNIGVIWYVECDGADMTPEEAVDEELSNWGG